MHAKASSKAANLIPMFLTPKTVLAASGKCKAKFPEIILRSQSTSE